MSGLARGVKKVFKSVGKAIKKVVQSKAFKIVAGLAAAYFTFGIATGVFSGAEAVASLPGFGEGGVFASIADATGASSLYSGGAAAAAGPELLAGGEALTSGAPMVGVETSVQGGGLVEGAMNAGRSAIDAIGTGVRDVSNFVFGQGPGAGAPVQLAGSVDAGAVQAYGAAQQPGLIRSAANWVQNLSPGGAALAGNVISGVGAGINAQNMRDEQRRQEEEMRRMRSVGDYRYMFNTPAGMPQYSTPQAAQGLIGAVRSGG